jgi:hypothetical protein
MSGCCKPLTSCIAQTVICNSSTYKLKRASIGQHDENGRWSNTTRTEQNLKANIQPVIGKELDQVPEGRRNKATIKIYTIDELFSVTTKSGEKRQPDIIEYKNEDYEIFQVWDWNTYFKSFASVREQNGN